MCQTNLISSNIVRLSTRSYRQRVEAAAPGGFSLTRLRRLNRDLDNFYELLYSQWTTVTKEDYNIFGNQMKIMLSTLAELLTACRRFHGTIGATPEVEQLAMNYSAIKELDTDIRNFRLQMAADNELKLIMKRASEATVNLAL